MKLTWLICGLAIFVAGCGGAGHTRFGTDSPFAGSYDGTWEDPIAVTQGNLDVVVSSDSEITGFIDHPSHGAGSVTGLMATDGDISGKFTYPGNLVFNYSGSLVETSGGLSGNVSVTQNGGGATVVYEVEFTKE
jgi:hypothetical protein